MEWRVSFGGAKRKRLVFRHADGTVYGGEAKAEDLEAYAEAFAALRALGLEDGEIHRALTLARAHVGRDGSVPAVPRPENPSRCREPAPRSLGNVAIARGDNPS
jgi:hypothetical protein